MEKQSKTSGSESCGKKRRRLPRMISSKYDFVKVRIWVQSHYYILSRYVLSRALRVAKVAPGDHIKIALHLKKELVDRNLLDISQEVLDNELVVIMRKFGYSEPYVSRFRMMTRLHHRRCPLLILIFGTGCCGKSTIATQLAERINIPNVVQTSLVRSMIGTGVSDLGWIERCLSKEEVVSAFQQECEGVRQGIDADLQKCFNQGKAVIIEGLHLDPQHYMDYLRDGNASTESSDCSKEYSSRVVVVPFLLVVSEKQHRGYLENWMQRNAEMVRQHDMSEKRSAFRQLQRYLLQFSEEVATIDVNASHGVDTSVDEMHDIVLRRIEDAWKKEWF